MHCLTPTCTDKRRTHHCRTHTQDSPPLDQQVHSKVSLRRAVDAVQRCVRTGRQGRESGTTRKPVNLAVRWCGGVPDHPPDYPTTVRPPPKRS
jgi:hypothetical protein